MKLAPRGAHYVGGIIHVVINGCSGTCPYLYLRQGE